MLPEIQDSDDDFDVTSPARPGDDDDPSPCKSLLEPVASLTKTTSTEGLGREIQHVQQQLVGSSLNVIRPSLARNAPVEPTSSPIRSSKRRKTMNSPQSGTAENKREHGKTMKTYGSSSKRTRDLVGSGSSIFDELKNEWSTSALRLRESNEEHGKESAEKIWDLSATLQQDFQQHHPVSMFPDPSSTVPDNSMTQQLLIQEALTNVMLPPPIPLADPAENTTSSIPWSTYLNSPDGKIQTAPNAIEDKETLVPERKSQAFAKEQNSQASTKVTQISEMLVLDSPTPPLTSFSWSNILPQDEPSNTPPGSPVEVYRLRQTITASAGKSSLNKLQRTKTLSPQATMNFNPKELVDELALERPRPTQAKRRRSQAPETRPAIHNNDYSIDPDPIVSDVVNKEAEAVIIEAGVTKSMIPGNVSPKSSEQPTKVTSQPAAPKKPKGKLKQRGDGAAAPISDDFIVGSPIDQYKPRPSRSRSTRAAEDTSIDYSARPEWAMKAKRRKTVNDVSLGSPPEKSDKEKMSQIGSMGFTPRQTKAALMETFGNVERAIDHLISQSSQGKENLRSKRRKNRPKSKKEPEGPIICSEFVGVEVTQRSAKEAEPAADPEDLPREVTEQDVLGKQEDAWLEVTNPSDPFNDKPPKNDDLSAKKSSAQKWQRDRVVDSDDEEDFAGEPEPPKPKQKPAAKRMKSLSDATAQTTKQPAEEPKRARGRPRKVVAHIPSIEQFESAAIFESETAHTGVGEVTHAEANASKEVTLEPEKSKGNVTVPSAIPQDGALPISTPEQNADSAAQTSQKCVVAKVAVQHSPLNKSKVPLRVGLSRNTRIAPLLRIIKK